MSGFSYTGIGRPFEVVYTSSEAYIASSMGYYVCNTCKDYLEICNPWEKRWQTRKFYCRTCRGFFRVFEYVTMSITSPKEFKLEREIEDLKLRIESTDSNFNSLLRKYFASILLNLIQFTLLCIL